MLGNSSWHPSCDRWCYIVANYIACELCAAQERVEKEQCIIERIGSMLSLYVEDNDTSSTVHKEKTLLTLIAIPKLYGQANIITVFYRLALYAKTIRLMHILYYNMLTPFQPALSAMVLNIGPV